jgi:hypothetical protein
MKDFNLPKMIQITDKMCTYGYCSLMCRESAFEMMCNSTAPFIMMKQLVGATMATAMKMVNEVGIDSVIPESCEMMADWMPVTTTVMPVTMPTTMMAYNTTTMMMYNTTMMMYNTTTTMMYPMAETTTMMMYPTTETTTYVPMIEACTQPMMVGNCEGTFNSWYFNKATYTCGQFVFTGCGGNMNRFMTMNECMMNCQPYIDSMMATTTMTVEVTTTTVDKKVDKNSVDFSIDEDVNAVDDK